MSISYFLQDLRIIDQATNIRGTALAIDKGLKTGDRVVESAQFLLYSESPVNIITCTPIPFSRARASRDSARMKPGEKIPTDGRVIEGQTTINQAMRVGLYVFGQL